MKFYRDLSITWKLTLLAVVTSLLVLLGTTVTFSIIDFRSTRTTMIESYSTMADVLGQNCLPSLDFSDTEDARQVLSSIRLDSQVVLASLYDDHDLEFVSFPGDTVESPAFSQIQTLDRVFGHDGYLHVVRPIRRESKIVGHIYLRVGHDKLLYRSMDQLTLAMFVLFVSILLSVALASYLQRAISSPILQLVQTAHQVVQNGDYSLRALKTSNDELGELVVVFNQLLGATEDRNRELKLKTKEAMDASVAKGAFLANTSHEIRTPLNAIMGYADLLQRGWYSSDKEHDEMLATVQSSGRHLMTVINDILDLSKIESGHIEIDVKAESPHAILAEVVSLMSVQFREKNLILDYCWEGKVPKSILTDGQRLRQILINLIGNSKKFTLAGGVRIVARISGEAMSSRLEIDVVDSGVGIPDDKLHQIFEPFMQADSSVTRRFGGTGLGLSISRRLARLMGGDLTAESSPGSGSVFHLSVATGDLTNVEFAVWNGTEKADSSKSAKTKSLLNVPRLNGMNVLVVDDGSSNRKFISLILNRAGAELTEATNGQEACDLALGDRRYDVILLDMQMPVMDGYTTALTLRTAGLKTPIIALTANAMKEDRERCMQAGCSDYLAKPLSAEDLFQRLKLIHADSTGQPGTAGSCASHDGFRIGLSLSR